MLNEILGKVQLDHQPSGAPFLKNRPNTHISISHSGPWFTIYISEIESVGIDIEMPVDQIKKTEKHFLTKSEINLLKPSAKQLAICWGIKESVYKVIKGNITSMKEDIQILSIDMNQTEAMVREQKIDVNYTQNEDFTLVYTN